MYLEIIVFDYRSRALVFSWSVCTLCTFSHVEEEDPVYHVGNVNPNVTAL